jgi:hypothetical protein
MKKVYALALSLFAVQAVAQQVIIRKVELAGEKIIVHYDLEDNTPNREYELKLYSSKDNFASPLTKVTGDIGQEVKPGTGKKVEWNVLQEFGGYKGKIALEIKGRVFSPFVKLQGFDASRTYKRGKSYNLAWKPGNSNPIHIELYKGGQRITGEMNQPNNGSHTFFIPPKAGASSDYRLKITDARQSEDVLFTDNFKVKPKLPLLLKVLPVVAVVGGVVLLSGQLGGEKESDDTGNEIPDPDFPRN